MLSNANNVYYTYALYPYNTGAGGLGVLHYPYPAMYVGSGNGIVHNFVSANSN
jgi:hypothetical protein